MLKKNVRWRSHYIHIIDFIRFLAKIQNCIVGYKWCKKLRHKPNWRVVMTNSVRIYVCMCYNSLVYKIFTSVSILELQKKFFSKGTCKIFYCLKRNHPLMYNPIDNEKHSYNSMSAYQCIWIHMTKLNVVATNFLIFLFSFYFLLFCFFFFFLFFTYYCIILITVKLNINTHTNKHNTNACLYTHV